MSADPFAEDLATKGAAPAIVATADPFAADLAAKQKQWEASPKYAALKAKHDATVAKTSELHADSGDSPWSQFKPEALWRDKNEIASNMLKGGASVASDELNAATLGAYKPVRNYIAGKVAPESLKGIQADEAMARETPGYSLISGIGQAGASTLGAPGRIANALTSAARPILSAAAGGAVTGGLQSSIESAGRGESVGDNLKSTAVGALAGGATGAAIGGVSRLFAGAPARAAESELGGLKEGVQNKTRIQKFEPNEDSFRTALAAEPKLRALAKADPVAARPEFHRMVEQKADTLLNPFYSELKQAGKDLVPAETIENQLKAARAGFNRVTEKAQIANINEVIDDMKAISTENGGRGVPAQFVRQTATSFGNTGFKNLPMLEAPGAAKQLKQDVSAALRESIADHIESIAPTTETGKAFRESYEQANHEVSTWIKMRDIVDEKARRVAGNATAAADVMAKGAHMMLHPKMTAAKILIGAGPEAVDKAIAPVVSSRAGQAVAPFASAAAQAGQAVAPPAVGSAVAGNPLVGAALGKRKREEDAAAAFSGGGR